jgi:hypothetical protein
MRTAVPASGTAISSNARLVSGMAVAHPQDRPKDPYGGTNTIHSGGDHVSYLLIPVIP